MGGTAASYSYDGDDVRVSQTVGGQTSWYVYDRLSGLPLLIDDGTQGYVHAGGVLSQADSQGTTDWLLADALGSVRGVADGSGALAGTNDYAAFGSPRAQGGTASTSGFTGEQTDASTGNVYLRARYHSPSTGRFLSADTVQPNAPGTQGHNLYAYVANNPTTLVDPTGHLAIPIGLALVIIFIFLYIALCLAQVICPPLDGQASPGDFAPNLTPPTASRPCFGTGCFAAIVWDFVTAPFVNYSVELQHPEIEGETIIPGRIFADEDEWFADLEKNHGLDPNVASERLHDCKRIVGRRGKPKILGGGGNVWDPRNGNWVCNVLSG